MSNNLYISYDLYSPGQNYEKVAEAIKALGAWAKMQKSFWYVKSSLTATQARDRVWAAMDKNDSLIVIDATHNDAAWINLDPVVGKHMKDYWMK